MSSEKKKTSSVLGAWDLVFLVLVICLPIYWILDPLNWFADWKYKPFAIPLVWFILRWPLRAALKSPHGLWEKTLFKKITVACLSPFLLFLGFEFFLAKIGFSEPLQPIIIKGDKNEVQNQTRLTSPDRELIYRFNPGVMFNGRPVNSMGFLDREVDPEKMPGSRRVICMGDSCTGQGIPPYSGMLHKRLQERPVTDEPWEAFNMAVHGYSSTQGLKLYQLRTKDLKPDVVTLYYGWNDHWRGNRPDAFRMAIRVREGWPAYVTKKLRSKLFYQFLVKVTRPVDLRQQRDAQKYVLRVSPDEYRHNLLTFVKEIRAVDALPVLITAPRDKTLSKHLVKNRQAQTIEDAIERHDRYNNIVREVAEITQAPLLDLAKDFTENERYEYFTDDGIHLTTPGREYIADKLYTLIEATYPPK